MRRKYFTKFTFQKFVRKILINGRTYFVSISLKIEPVQNRADKLVNILLYNSKEWFDIIEKLEIIKHVLLGGGNGAALFGSRL